MSENYIQMIAEDKVYPIIRCKDAECKAERHLYCQWQESGS